MYYEDIIFSRFNKQKVANQQFLFSILSISTKVLSLLHFLTDTYNNDIIQLNAWDGILFIVN